MGEKRRLGFVVNTKARPISFKLIPLGEGLEAGPSNGTCKAGCLCTADTGGEVKRDSLIYIPLLF